MSRTVHSGIVYAGVHRSFRNMNHRRNELSALEEIQESGIKPSNRLKSFWSRIPEVFDDYSISANDEFFGKNHWKVWRESENQSHWTRN